MGPVFEGVQIETPRAGAASGAAFVKRVFVIDDDEVMLLSCRRILEKDGFEVETFGSALAGLARLEESRPPLVLVDLKMPELNGLQVIERIRAIDPHIVISVITGYATIATAVEAMSTGAHDFLPKPFTPDELRIVVKRASERWRLIQESERHRREREAVERRIVTFVSHQLKSPAAAAKQYLDVLLHTSRAEFRPATLEWIERASGRLGDMVMMIDDWLTLARVERGLAGEPGATVAVDDVVQAILAAATPQAKALDIDVASDIPAAPVVVRGDRASIEMVVSNLVANAIKYNRRPGHLAVRLTADATTATLEVSDSGIGIDAESLPHVFDEFYRASAVKERGISGSGLGLAICRRIVSELGGDIQAQSTPDVGTTFVVRLPLAKGQS